MNTEFRTFFGERLRAERERLGLSQPDMAALGGVKPRTYQDWERGVAVVSAEFLSVANAHGLDSSYVITGQRSTGALSGPAPALADAEDVNKGCETRYTTEQLLFSAKVRELAVGLRTKARSDAWQAQFAAPSCGNAPAQAQREEWEANWRRCNPVEDFIGPALERIHETARLIQDHPAGPLR